MSSKEVEYFAGLDYLGAERWIVGFIDEREQRQDGEWFHVRPKVPDVWGERGGRWVTIDHIRAWSQPKLGRGR